MARYVEGKLGWALLVVGLVMLGAVLVSTLAGEEDQSFTATRYADVIRFKAKGVTSLRVGIYDLSGQELWASGVRTGQIVDWERTNEWGERLAYGVYLYAAQGWDAQGGVVLETSGKLAFLPGDQVQLQVAPSVASDKTEDGLAPFEDGAITVQPKALGQTYICSVLGVGTAAPGWPVHIRSANQYGIQLEFTGTAIGRANLRHNINIGFRLEKQPGLQGAQAFSFAVYEYLAGATNLFTIWNDTTGQGAMVIDGNTNDVGIGTLTPANRLDVSNPGGFQLGLTDPSGPDHWELDVWGFGLDFWDTFGNNPVGFEVGAPNGALYVAANGGVGIGTNWNTPGAGLDIAADINGNELRLIESGCNVTDHANMYFDVCGDDWSLGVNSGNGIWYLMNMPANYDTLRSWYDWGNFLGWVEVYDNLWVNNLIDTWDCTVWNNLNVWGIKNFVEEDPTDPTKVIVYAALEGPEAGTYVRGTAELVGGEAVIFLPDHFGKVTAAEGLTVVLTPVGGWRQLYVVEKSTSHIVVREATGQDGTFDYLVQGIRAGYEDFQVVRDRTEHISRVGRESPSGSGVQGGPPGTESPVPPAVPQGGGKEERTPPTE